MAMLARWLHIYLSMISFAIVFFFAVTGLTLNHADKFANQLHTVQEKGKLNLSWINNTDTLKIAKLEIVEYLRKNNSIKAAMSDFRIDDSQIGVSFKGPGYTADAFINRQTGSTILRKRARDLSASLTIYIKVVIRERMVCIYRHFRNTFHVVSLSGMLLLLFIKRKRVSGFIVAACGLLLAYLIYMIWIK